MHEAILYGSGYRDGIGTYIILICKILLYVFQLDMGPDPHPGCGLTLHQASLVTSRSSSGLRNRSFNHSRLVRRMSSAKQP